MFAEGQNWLQQRMMKHLSDSLCQQGSCPGPSPGRCQSLLGSTPGLGWSRSIPQHAVRALSRAASHHIMYFSPCKAEGNLEDPYFELPFNF